MTSPPTVLRLGTRGSLLARTQSQWVASELARTCPGLRVELVVIRTTGDAIVDKPLHDVGGKGLFTKELEQALLAVEVDFAVHSYKDVPVTMPLVDATDLIIAATPVREDSRDAVALRHVAAGQASPSLGNLPSGSIVGTGSLRRRCQLLAERPDLVVQPIRGNIDTRLRKLREGAYDAVVLALAGLKRTGLFDAGSMYPLEPREMLSAAGQGALALQCRRDDERTLKALATMHDPVTELCVSAERDVVRKLEGDCHSPIAVLATVERHQLRLRAAVGARDGGLPVIVAEASGAASNCSAVVDDCWRLLSEQGVRRLLHGADNTARA